jgi:hypothetical protein
MKSSEKLFEFLNHINKLMDDYKQEIGGMTDVELNRKLGKESWSIAQVLDHVVVTKKAYLERFDEQKQKFIPFTDVDEKTSVMGRWMMKYVEPKRGKKTRTVKVFLPDENKSSYDLSIKEQLYESQLLFKKIIEECNNYALYGNKISSPANKLIKFHLGEVLEIILMHEERHLEQIREIKSHDLFKI